MPTRIPAYLRLASLIATQLESTFDSEAVDEERIQALVSELMEFEYQLDDAGSWLIMLDDGVGLRPVAHVYCTYGDALRVAACLFPTETEGFSIVTDKLRVESIPTAIAAFDELTERN